MTITDNAYLISKSKDQAMYQHAQTRQLFQTVAQADGYLELFIFNDGVWHSEGIACFDSIALMVANITD